MSTEAAQGKRSPWYIFHVVVFLLITFGFGYLPTFAMITPLGMKVLGAFLGLFTVGCLLLWTGQA